jgi:hypothetical protein
MQQNLPPAAQHSRPRLRLVPRQEPEDGPEPELPPNADVGQTPRQTLERMVYDVNLPVDLRLHCAMHLLAWCRPPVATIRIGGLEGGGATPREPGA